MKGLLDPTRIGKEKQMGQRAQNHAVGCQDVADFFPSQRSEGNAGVDVGRRLRYQS